MLGRVDVRKLALLMLQAYAGELRKGMAIPFHFKHFGALPFEEFERTWRGCRRSIMLMSGESLLTVQLFVREWMASRVQPPRNRGRCPSGALSRILLLSAGATDRIMKLIDLFDARGRVWS